MARQPFITLVDQILAAKKKDPTADTSALEKQIDEMVYKLYGLTEEEIAIVNDSHRVEGKWHNRNHDEDTDKESPAKLEGVAAETPGYELSKDSASRKGVGLGSCVHGVREGAGEYDSSEGTPEERGECTSQVDSTRYFETSQGNKSYSEVSEALAISVAKTLKDILKKSPEEIAVTSEWLCLIHKTIAGNIFPEWAGHLRNVNVQVGSHTPPPYFEVPVHLQMFCDDLSARLRAGDDTDIEALAELLAFADWRFQWIHPFKDFNGRVGRILLSALLFKLKLPPAETAAVQPKSRKTYLSALRAADNGDVSPLKDIWLERLHQAAGELDDNNH